jgi:hypothetical protein
MGGKPETGWMSWKLIYSSCHCHCGALWVRIQTFLNNINIWETRGVASKLLTLIKNEKNKKNTENHFNPLGKVTHFSARKKISYIFYIA